MRTKNTSDQNGRALEYAIAFAILNNFKNVKIDDSTVQDQARDKTKFDELDESLKNSYTNSSATLIDWLNKKYSLSNKDINSLSRLSDDEAKKGDVTDIRLVIRGEVVNLSIKHNHTALKHQRPGATPQQCGFRKKSYQDLKFRSEYKNITDNFIGSAKLLNSSVTLYRELIAIQSDFVDKNLYAPICSLVNSFLNECGNIQSHAQFFFEFLTGMTNYYKVVVYSDRIVINEFAQMPSVTSLVSTQLDNSHISVNFSNGWIVNLRLHTASSRITPVSIKFDTQPTNINVPTETIKLP